MTTNNGKYYLRPNVMIEPLFNQWYAWPLLIAPHTAAMNIANLHLKIMKSYVAAPQIHANAVKNPALLGGPFIDYNGGRVSDIKALITKTTKEQAHLIEFADSVKRLDQILKSQAKGYSLEPLYPSVPENLRGYVELVYDLNNNPAIRYLEGLLYRSKYYDPALQSISISLIEEDGRAFALSTPRLPDEKKLHWNVPFADERIDSLFVLRKEPQPYAAIVERLRLEPHEEEIFKTFLTEEAPPPQSRYEGEGIRLRYYGHATVLLETSEVSIMTDPAISYLYNNGIDRYTFMDLPPKIDYVLITHSHQDHVMFESLLQLRHKVGNVVVPRSRGGSLEDPSLKMILNHLGFSNVIEIDEMEQLNIPGGTITGLPFLGEHCDLNIGSKMAHLISLKEKTFLFAADSNNLEPALYKHIYDTLGDVNVLFLGMECDGAPMSWLYGPLLLTSLDRGMDQSRRFSGSNYEKGLDIVNQFNCNEVYVYAMGQEPWLTYALSIKYTEESNPIVDSNKLVETCQARSITSERLFGKKECFYLT
ncbi:MAG TPA: MBL fold metallo-hydrolase [Pyrinomonadaceae bacterium]|nr:MBL fold metallo-hydrolase [Pyrinomonadaceae bacterium]